MSKVPSRSVLLAARINELTTALDTYHAENNLPSPSFDEDNWREHQYPQGIERTRSELEDALTELQDLAIGSQKMLRLKLAGTHNFLDVIYTFDIAKHVPINGHVSYKELSTAVGVNESILKRMLRTAICHRMFQEKEPGFVSHSAASRLLAEERKMHDWLGANIHFIHPPTLQQAAAVKKWPDAEGPSQAAFNLSDTTGSGSFWKFLAAEPERARMFSSSMAMMAQSGANSFDHVVDNYPFAELGAGTVIDIGGSTGGLGFAIAEKFPDLNVIVQDLPKTITNAQERPGVNVKFMNHDYNQPQTVVADLYIYRWCFHDMHDGDGIRALQALIPALKKGARILLVDAVMPEPGFLPNVEA